MSSPPHSFSRPLHPDLLWPGDPEFLSSSLCGRVGLVRGAGRWGWQVKPAGAVEETGSGRGGRGPAQMAGSFLPPPPTDPRPRASVPATCCLACTGHPLVFKTLPSSEGCRESGRGPESRVAGGTTCSKPVTQAPVLLAACGSKSPSRARCRENDAAGPRSPCLCCAEGPPGSAVHGV